MSVATKNKKREQKNKLHAENKIIHEAFKPETQGEIIPEVKGESVPKAEQAESKPLELSPEQIAKTKELCNPEKFDDRTECARQASIIIAYLLKDRTRFYSTEFKVFWAKHVNIDLSQFYRSYCDCKYHNSIYGVSITPENILKTEKNGQSFKREKICLIREGSFGGKRECWVSAVPGFDYPDVTEQQAIEAVKTIARRDPRVKHLVK